MVLCEQLISVAGDVVQLLDMRFLVGLRVSISGSTEVRAKALSEKAKASGAKLVAATHSYREGSRFVSGWTEVWRKEAVHG